MQPALLQRVALCNTFGRQGTGLLSAAHRAMSSNATPPPDADRKGTADLTDKYMPDPVDSVCTRSVQVVTPNLFR
jgi:hypothetical protein